MFEYIKGTLQYKGTDFCVIDVGGIGFKIYTFKIQASHCSFDVSIIENGNETSGFFS